MSNYTPSTENQRAAENDARNTCRFFTYNNRRALNGLSHLSFFGFLQRKHPTNPAPFLKAAH